MVLLLVCGCNANQPSGTEKPFDQSVLIKETDMYRVIQLGKQSYAIESLDLGKNLLLCNSGFIITEQGVVVIDPHTSLEGGKILVSEIKNLTDQPIIYAINTHSHNDHVLGNGALPLETNIICHNEALELIERLSKNSAHDDEEVRVPNETIGENTILFEGKDEVHLVAFDKAHSKGDISVYYPKDQVVYTGDIFVKDAVGAMAYAFMNPWENALQYLIDLEGKFYVPGHGEISTKDDIAMFKAYLNTFIETTINHFELTNSADGYQLPEQYNELGYKDKYLKINVARAYLLWVTGDLTKR